MTPRYSVARLLSPLRYAVIDATAPEDSPARTLCHYATRRDAEGLADALNAGRARRPLVKERQNAR